MRTLYIFTYSLLTGNFGLLARSPRLWMALGLLLLSSTLGYGQATSLVLWNFHNAPQPAPEPFLSTAFDVRMNQSPLTRGEGVTLASRDSGFVATSWNAQNKADAIAQGEYLQFTVDAKDVFKVSLATLHAIIYRTVPGPNVYQFQYSLDGFQTAGIDASPEVTLRRTVDASPRGKVQDPPIDLTTIADLQEVLGTTTVTFRIYAWGSTSGEGIFGFFYRDDINTLRVTGTIAPIANPAYVWNPHPGSTADAASGVEGAIIGDWERAEFWTPNRTNPTPQDILLFDTGINTLVSRVLDEEIHQIRVANNTTVTLRPPNDPGISAATITFNAPAPALALVVESGSTLRFTTTQGTRSVVFQFPPSSQALIGGTMIFDSAPDVAALNMAARQANHRLLATDPGAIIFQTGSTFIGGKFTGHPFGNIETGGGYNTPGTTIFQAGSTYISRGGLSPFGLPATPAKTIFEPESLFILEDYDFAPQLAGRTYAGFVIDLAGAPSERQTLNILNAQSPDPMTVDNFTIENGVLNFTFTALSSQQYLNINVNGAFNVNNASIFNYTTPQPSTLSFVGTDQPQSIGVGGTITFGTNTTLQINTPVSVTLTAPLTLDGNLQLTQGTLFTSASNLLSINPTGTIDGGGPNSFVEGPLRQGVAAAGPISLMFPLGVQEFAPDGNTYRPIIFNLTLQDASPAFFTATMVEGSPTPERDLPAVGEPPVGLERVSGVRHYTVAQDSPGVVTGGTVTISFGPDDEVTQLPFLRIATANLEPTWIDLGQLSATEGAPIGTITATLQDAPTFGTFVLANAIGGNNPLPVELVSFTAKKESLGVLLNWATASENNNRGFEILRSTNGVEWVKAGFVNGNGNSQAARTYAFTDKDASLEVATLYYRLKQIDLDGTFAFSKVVAIQTDPLAAPLALYPNPVADELNLNFGQLSQNIQIRIINLLGQVVFEKDYADQISQLIENVSFLPAGAYQLEVYYNQNRTFRKFVKTSR